MQGHVGPFKYEKTVQNQPIRFVFLKSTRLKFKNVVRRRFSSYSTLKSFKRIGRDVRVQFRQQGLFSSVTNRLREVFIIPYCDSTTECKKNNNNRLIALMEWLSKIQNIREIYRGNMAYLW